VSARWIKPAWIGAGTLRRPAIVTIHDVSFLLQPDAYGSRDIAAIAAAILDVADGRIHLDPEDVRASIVQRFGPDALHERMTAVYDRVSRRTPRPG
jgi:hypothetical protein